MVVVVGFFLAKRRVVGVFKRNFREEIFGKAAAHKMQKRKRKRILLCFLLEITFVSIARDFFKKIYAKNIFLFEYVTLGTLEFGFPFLSPSAPLLSVSSLISVNLLEV